MDGESHVISHRGEVGRPPRGVAGGTQLVGRRSDDRELSTQPPGIVHPQRPDPFLLVGGVQEVLAVEQIRGVEAVGRSPGQLLLSGTDPPGSQMPRQEGVVQKRPRLIQRERRRDPGGLQLSSHRVWQIGTEVPRDVAMVGAPGPGPGRPGGHGLRALLPAGATGGPERSDVEDDPGVPLPFPAFGGETMKGHALDLPNRLARVGSPADGRP